MNIKAMSEVLNSLETKSFTKGYLKEKRDLDKEVLNSLVATACVKRTEPFFLFLRRFNSYTPAIPFRSRISTAGTLSAQAAAAMTRARKDIEKTETHRIFTNVKGGGCFLSWDGKGVVIDPGFDFIENMYSENLAIGDIDAIVITHAHNDHYIDLDPILTLAFQYNKLSRGLTAMVDEDYEEATRELTELERFQDYEFITRALKYCALKLRPMESVQPNQEKLEAFLKSFEEDFKEDIEPKLCSGALNPNKQIKLFFTDSAKATLQHLVKIKDKQGNDVGVLGDAEGPLNISDIPLKLSKSMQVEEIETQHNDFKATRGKGLILGLHDFSIAITSDTGWYDRTDEALYDKTHFPKDASEAFAKCDLLIPHIGSIKTGELNWSKVPDAEKQAHFKKYRYETHLGILGLLRLISDMKIVNHRLKLVTITEFGEEMKHMRHYLAQEIDNCNELNKDTKYLAADIGLQIRLRYAANPIKVRITVTDPRTGLESYDYEKPENVQEVMDPFTGKLKYVRKIPKP